MQGLKKKKSAVNISGPLVSRAGHWAAVVSALSDNGHCRRPTAEAHSFLVMR